MKRSGIIRFGVPVVLLALGLAGCTGGDSARTASPTPPPATPTTDPGPGPAATILISPTELAILDGEDDVIGSHVYTGDTPGMVDLLSAALGSDPEVFVPGPDACSDNTTYSWARGPDSLFLAERPIEPGAPYTRLVVTTSARQIGSLDIETSAGFAIGDDVSALVSGLQADEKDEDSGLFIWARTASTTTEQGVTFAFGGFGQFDATGVATFVGAPGTMSGGFC